VTVARREFQYWAPLPRFLGVPLILMVVALLASYIPARGAARVNPIVALREG
jgi:ABC-type lipoprotein release transport system permease subunit